MVRPARVEDLEEEWVRRHGLTISPGRPIGERHSGVRRR
jgi:hypothetical protein